MGGCLGNQKVKKRPLERYDQEPQDTQKIYSQNLPRLAFQALLTNVKVKSCQYDTLSIKFSIDNVQQFALTKKDIEKGTAKWRIEHKFGFMMTEYQLRKQLLKIQFLDQAESVVGMLKINLYLISTGPYHLDFAVTFKNKTYGRISFDLKISQVIQVSLQCNRAEVDLHKKHPGQRFSFSIQSLIDNARIFSKPSYNIRIKLDNREKDQSDIPSVGSQLGMKKNSKLPQKQMQVDKNLIWQQHNSHLYLPALTIGMQASDLHHGCFRILLWKLNDENYKKQHKQQGEKLEFYGDCYISFQNIFLQTYKILERQSRKMECREIQIKQKLWSNGREMGKANFKFTIQNEKYIKQMYICVRTEQGILTSTPVFDLANKGKNDSSQCEEIKKLVQLSQSIQSKVIQLQKQHLSNHQSRILQISIQNDLSKINPLLQKTCKQSFLFYNYSSKKQLMKAQAIFIDIGTKIFNYIQQDDPHISQMCWLILISLLKRGQFMLSHMGFSQEEKQSVMRNNINHQLRQKIDVALQYQQFLYKLLYFALNALNVKGLDLQRSFAEIFCAFAYFRIPKFRDQFLNAVCHKQDQQIIEMRQIQANLKDEVKYSQIQESVNTFTILFDWKNQFHSVIEKQEKYKLNNSQLADILSKQDSEWRERMKKRGSAFFYFLSYWVNYVEDVAVKSKDIQWKYFPGYNKLMKSFLVQLKKRSILQYPDAMKTTCEKLLCNEKMLNYFVTILLGKANINQPLTILKSITMISSLFSTLQKKNRKIPQTFNYILFFKAIKIVIMETDFSCGISQVLCMLYNHFHMFQKNFRLNIALFLLGKAFFRLFLFWSQNVRDIFYHLILMRIYNQSLQIHQETCTKAQDIYRYNESIRTRFQKLITILQNEQKLREEEKKQKIGLIFEKQYYKRMRKKLNKKLRKKSEEILLDSLNLVGAKTEASNQNFMLTDTGFFMNQKQQMHRTNSVVFQPNVIQLINNSKHHPTEAVVKIRRHTDIQQTKKYLKNISQGPQLQLFLDENDSQFGTIKPVLRQYLPISLSSYREVKKTYENIIRQKKGQFPNVKMEMPIDNKQLRPDKIDNW